MAVTKRKRNLAPTPKPGGRGYDVVIGARRKHFESHTAAHRYGMDQQNKGVHAEFVIVDSATGKRERFKRSGAKGNPKLKEVSFTTDKRGKPLAYKFTRGAVFPRNIRISYDEAKMLVSTGQAKEIPYRPMRREWMAPNPKTIYQALADKLGRAPTNAELKAEVSRIKEEGYLIGKRKKRNPEAGAASLYEMFHGAPSEGETVVHEDLHIHEHLGELGVLGGLKVRTVSGYDVTLEFVQDKANNPKDVISKAGKKTKGWIDRRFKAMSGIGRSFARTWLNPRGKGPVILCANEVGDSMYLRSGDQALDLDKLHLGGEFKKDSVVIGEVWLLGYLTEKSFDDWKNLFYVHGLGDEDAHPKIGKKKDLWDDAKPPETLFCTGQLPMLIYDRLSELMSFSGGVYRIKPEGIVD